MKEELISFKTAKLAREKGFINKDVDSFYNDDGTFELNPINYEDKKEVLSKGFSLRYDIYLAPTQALLQKYIRDVHNIHISIDSYGEGGECKYLYSLSYTYSVDKMIELELDDLNIVGMNFDIFEEALEIGLQEELKLIKI